MAPSMRGGGTRPTRPHHTGTGEPPDAAGRPPDAAGGQQRGRPSPDAIRQLEDAFGTPATARSRRARARTRLDYDDIVQQSFPASDPPPPPGGPD